MLPLLHILRNLLGGSIAGLPLLERYQADAFVKAANKTLSGARRGLFGGRKTPQSPRSRGFTLEDMLCFQKVGSSIIR